MKRINVYVGAVLRWSAYKSDAEYQAWIDACIAANIWGLVGTYTVEVIDATVEYAEVIAKNEVITRLYADENYYKKSDILGAVSTIVQDDLSANKILISNAQGKVAATSSATSTEVEYLAGVTSAVQDQIDGKEPTITGAATSITGSNLTADRAVVSDGSGKIAASATTATEVGHLSGVTSAIQTQINSKANKTDTELRGTINWAKDGDAELVDISELISFSPTMGVIEGGQITVSSGLTINVSATVGYTSSSEVYATQKLEKISANADTLALPANSNVYVYYTSSGVLSYNVTQPNSRTNVLLGRVVTNATDVVYIEKGELDSHHWGNYVDSFLREALGAIFASGGIVTENGTTPRQLDINSGVYYYGEHRLTFSGATPISFNAYYRNGSGGYSVQAPASTVSNSLYDDGSGTLASVTNNYYVKHLLVGIKEQTGNQKFILIYGDSEWSSLEGANSANLPASPEFIKNTFVRLASIVVKQGTNAIQNIIDERPRVGFSPSAVSAAIVSDHGGLSGLTDDDHTQYLLTNGGRSLTGNLDLGNNAIVSVSTLNGVTVESHASRHQPGGADAIPTATAVSIATVNAEGISTSLARADHSHKIDDGFVTNAMLAGSIDATKISDGTISNTEFGYLNGVTSAIQTQLDGKEPTITGAATSITSSNLTASRILVSDANGKVAVSSATSTEAGYLSGVTSAIQTQLDGKQATITGAASTVTISDLTASRAVVSDAGGKIAVSSTTSTEVGYLSGVTSAIQTQLDGKQFTITGAATSVTTSNLTIDRVLISDAGGKIAVSTTSSSEIGFLTGVTSSIQTQLNGKEPTIAIGTTAQYWRGDKTFQTLNAAAVANTPAGNIVATTVQAAINELDTDKQPTGNYITALTGDVSASGPGSAIATLSDTGVVAGTYSLVTVDSKGRITVGSNSGSVTRYAYPTTVIASTTSATYTSVAELTTISLPVGLYFFRFVGTMQSTQTQTGVGVRIAPVTATITTVSAKWNIAQGADGVSHDFEYDQLLTTTNVTSASVNAANTNFAVNGFGTFRVTVAGTVAIQIRTETAGQTATLQPGAAFISELV